MQTKLKAMLAIGIGLLLIATPSTYAQNGYCSDNIVDRSVTKYSVGAQELKQLCKTHDQCIATSRLGKSRCDRQFTASVERKCNAMYGSKKTHRNVCLFSAGTYQKLLQRYSH